MVDGMVTGELTVGGRERTVLMRPPSEPGRPLVLVLHGNQSGGKKREWRDWTTFRTNADRWGIGVAFPQGWSACWADGRGVTLADEAGVDDVAFLRAVIEWSAERYETVAEHSIVAGISNGAFMAHRAGLEIGDLVPVFAAVAGGLPADLAGVKPTHAVSAILINGDGDPWVPIEGGHSRHRGPDGELRGRTYGLAESGQHWRELNGCAGAGETIRTDQSERELSGLGTGGTRILEWTVFGGGHTWPGVAIPAEHAGVPGANSTMEFDGAEEIWRFAQPLLTSPEDRKL
ncbi:alpha/beta hydrolase family esterase [Nocardia tengchongensis]|uniref:alpha/beta hydrolase family esterase n=1 Tax=Nocardia tengchongensis TaxID=2055889 RepID=UPI0036B29BBA